MRTFYEILGISNNATQEEILTAYRKKVIENHPDRGGNAIEFMNTRKAYETLSDPVVRKKYDQWIINKISEQNKQRLNIYLNNFIRQICTDEILVSQLNHMLSDYNNTWIYKDLNCMGYPFHELLQILCSYLRCSDINQLEPFDSFSVFDEKFDIVQYFKKQAEQEKEDALWEEVIKQDTIYAYSKYLADYPNGKYVPSANKRISEMLTGKLNREAA